MNNEAAKHSVLIFEDDVDLLRQWTQALREQGIHVEIAMTVSEVEAHCARMKFDLIVCDIFIRDPNGAFVPQAGYTLLSALRNRLGNMPDWGKKVPILVVTGSQKSFGFDALVLAKSMGGTDVMRKPFPISQLVEKVFELLDANMSA